MRARGQNFVPLRFGYRAKQTELFITVRDVCDSFSDSRRKNENVDLKT